MEGNIDSELMIKYKLYKKDLLLNHFHITQELLPIYATLCSNDYFIIDEFPEFSNQIKNYSTIRQNTTHINIEDDLKNDSSSEETTTMENKQNIFIKEILKRKKKETEEEKEENFKNNLINSVKEYNLINLNHGDDDSYDSIICNEILNKYNSGNLILLMNIYRCNVYQENYNRAYCWNVTENLRKKLYELMICRNNIGLIEENKYKEDTSSPKKYTINEFIRIKLNFETKPVDICVNNHFPKTKNKLFITYLNAFNSNIPIIRNLPYYLIPLTTCLRCFLIEKIKANLFICDENDATYVNFIKHHKGESHCFHKEKKDTDMEEPKTPLYRFEFESLLASCIAALTFTFLNKKYYFDNKNKKSLENKSSEKSLSNPDDTRNKKGSSPKKTNHSNNKKEKEYNSDCHNMYYNLSNHNKRSLILKSKWGIENFQQDTELYGNSVQIFAEFLSVLNVNSQFLQALKITEYDRRYDAFFSMYHYQWEESFYSMIDSFKKIENKESIFHIFNKIYTVFDSKENRYNYLSYLQKIYVKLFKAILYIP
ncbi:hypothetical protein PIROE2DRAFT_3854 [Piromyces sp. E2]|nr:hypothetical protein PIROE2DRAFT_3854 [Piromyces sp. E2]|eukprot:OUM68410.1 hypothetical protein PIROE2DRAFT_3854 [Piromyces sp. E2]